MKNKADNLDVDKLRTVSIGFKKSSDVFDKDPLKKWKYNADKQGLDKKGRRHW